MALTCAVIGRHSVHTTPQQALGTVSTPCVVGTRIVSDACWQLLLFAVTQRISMNGLRHDGIVPTLTTTSVLYSLAINVTLSSREIAPFDGFQFQLMRLGDIWRALLAERLGNSMHVAVVGLVLNCAVASIKEWSGHEAAVAEDRTTLWLSTHDDVDVFPRAWMYLLP